MNMKQVCIFAFALCSALAAPGSDATAEFKISGDGETAEQKRAGNYSIKRFTPYKVSFQARKASAKTSGRTLCAGLPGLNVDLDLEEEWTSYSDIVMSPSGQKPVSEMPVRFSLWKVDGEVLVRNLSVVEQQAVHATDGELTLGDGETLIGTKYTFSDMPGSRHHNHSRPLFRWSGATLNTDRYPMSGRSEIIWRHSLAGRRFLSGEVTFSSRYFSGGEVGVEVSRDGSNWSVLGCMTATNRMVKLSLDTAMFPAENVYVRVKSVDAKGFQLGTYSFTGDVDGRRMFVSGRQNMRMPVML